MSHLLILCEGDTESAVLKSFLAPYWKQRFRTIEIQQYSGNGELKINFKADTERQLITEPDSSVLCLVDLYQEPFRLYQSDKMTPTEGFAAVKQHLYAQIRHDLHPRFGGFPVVMEIETWLLINNESEPESIAHPAEHIRKLFGNYGKGGKRAKPFFEKIAAEQVYQDTCPHFNLLIDWLITEPSTQQSTASPEIAARLIEWERKRDELYEQLLKEENEALTDADLNTAIQTEEAYTAHVKLYEHIYRQ